MASYIKTLKEDNGDITYPQTLASAVFTSGGSDVETELTKYVTAEDIASTSALSPVVSTSMIQDEAVTAAKIDSDIIDGIGKYSTTEVETTSTWIDGKKIYRRVFQFDAGSGDAKTIDIGNNVGDITSMFCMMKTNPDNSGISAFVPYANNDFNYIMVLQRSSQSSLYLYRGSQVRGMRYGTLVLEYTHIS